MFKVYTVSVSIYFKHFACIFGCFPVHTVKVQL